jgi:hypothetical protein
MLYDAAGAARDWLLGAAEVFWRAILAKASKMDEPFGAGLFCAWFCSEVANPGGGLPGGVVDSVCRLEELAQTGILTQLAGSITPLGEDCDEPCLAYEETYLVVRER